MLNNDMLPPPSFHLYPLGAEGSSVIYPREEDTLPALLQLNYELSILAAKLGQLARDFRKEATAEADDEDLSLKHSNIRRRRSRISQLQDAFRQLWGASIIASLSLCAYTLPKRSTELLVHVSTFFLWHLKTTR
jgi:hypothetical protein